jgi:hypothetical protein
VAFVQKTLFAALEAIRTNPMCRFAALHICFYHIGNRPGTDVLEFIAIFLCAPCFKPDYLFFKIAFALQQIELVGLDRERARLGT